MMHIYISGPYTNKEDPSKEGWNQAQAIRWAELIRGMGHHPFLPHTMYPDWSTCVGVNYQQVMDECLAWVGKCDALLRIAGDSPGAEQETDLAMSLGIPVANVKSYDETFGVVDYLTETPDHRRLASYLVSVWQTLETFGPAASA